MATVYISSTYSDLVEHRDKVWRALRRMQDKGKQHNVICMEDYVASDERPLNRCLQDVARSDLYIGLFAWRYGHIPKKKNPRKKSITEREYRHAEKLGKPRLIFLLDPTAQWPLDRTDYANGNGEQGRRIKQLRAELQGGERHFIGLFKTPEDLALNVFQAVLAHFEASRGKDLRRIP